MSTNILVIDDEANIRNMLKAILEEEGYKPFLAEKWSEAKKILLLEKIDVILLDIWLPEIGGMDILEILKKDFPCIEIIMISGHGNIEIAVKSTKLGAINFLEKPLRIDKTLSAIEKAIEMKKLKEENESLRKIVYKDIIMIGESLAMKTVKEQVNQASKSNTRVLILGGNGTGKESIAKAIHYQSSRSNKPFVTVNCAAIPDTLIESELFGYEKGAFTGANTQKKGKFELADGGTIFLDEIADMTLSTQAKVLRVLQEMEFERLGGNKTYKINVRVIAATNKDILKQIKENKFREDLYYRLNVIPIKVSDLKERKEDIPLLIDYYLTRFANDTNKTKKNIDKEAENLLISMDWPGNVRELINIIERLNVMVSDEIITIQDIKKYVLDKPEITETSVTNIDNLDKSLKEAKSEFEKLFIIEKLKENGMNISKTARALKMERSHLHKKIKQYDINYQK